ncbi:YqhA family protein [Flavobacteriaceae bacterium F89]|uniref:YqhA family protein n=1 Tax=Cerina litoralis TaxID=2874477 RepID=A0AAE3EZ67_9FLAO|nr:YqhA family protein [Cerina litoralis]MCG2462321.1 YqhA family protein [Cerina litoralis]
MKLLLRIIILIICVFTFLNALVFVGISVYHSVHAYTLIFQGRMEDRPGIYLAEALDAFLLAVVFIIFAIGIGKLFIPDIKILDKIQITWLEPKNFSELKVVLWEAILTTLVVLFATIVVQHMDNLTWDLLVIPAAVLLIAGGLKMLKSSH